MLKGLKLSYKKAAEQPDTQQGDTIDDESSRKEPRMYDFSKFEDKPLDETGHTRVESNIEALEKTADDAWTALLNNDFSKAARLVDSIENSAHWWLRGGDRIFGNSVFGSSKDGDPMKWTQADKQKTSVSGTNDPTEMNSRKLKEVYDYESEVNRLAKGKKNLDSYVDDEYDNLHSTAKPDAPTKLTKGYLARVQNRVIRKERREERILANCRFCLANALLKEVEVLSISDNFYLIQPNKSKFE